MKKILAVILALVLCLAFVAGCASEKKNPLDSKVITKIGDYEITQAFYNCHYYITYSNYAGYEQYLGEDWMNMDFGDGVKISELMDEDTKMSIVQFAVASIIAKEHYGITGKDVKSLVKTDMKELVDSYGDKATYKKELLEKGNMTEKALETYFELYEIFVLLNEKMAEDTDAAYVTEEEIQERLKDYPRVRHILVATQSLDGVTPAKSDKEAMEIVNEIYKKLENGEDFKALVSEYGEDPGMETNDYYVCGYGEMVPEFEEASASLEIGEYTKTAVKSDYGYHIIMRYAHDEESEAYGESAYLIAQEKLYEMLDAKVAETEIEWDDAAIEEHMLTWHENIKASMEVTE